MIAKTTGATVTKVMAGASAAPIKVASASGAKVKVSKAPAATVEQMTTIEIYRGDKKTTEKFKAQEIK